MLNFLRKQMKWVMAIIVVAFLLSTFLMYEGRGTRRTPTRNADGSMNDYEVAQINGRSLMRSELDRRLSDYLSTYSTRSAASLDMGAIYQSVLDQIVLEAQLAKAVSDSGITVSDAEADRAMKDYADRYYPTRETFYQALANSGVKIDDYKRSLARQMATETLLRNAVGEVVVSEDEALKFYDTMKSLIYSKPEGFMIHMADFRTSADAEYMRARLESGETWAAIVSGDELASHDVINVTREPVFLPASAFNAGTLNVMASLDVGTVSPVFSVTSFDYAVGLKTEHVDETVSAYDEVSADIRNMLTSQEERRRLAEYQTTLRNAAQVVINDQELFARAVVSEEPAPLVEDVIPELAEVSADAETEKPAEPETPAVVETPAETTEAPAEPATVEEAPAPVEEPVATEEAPAPVEEPVTTEEAPAETPETVEPAPAPAEETTTEEAPAPVEEAPAVVEETVTVEETPEIIETEPAAETVTEVVSDEVVSSEPVTEEAAQ